MLERRLINAGHEVISAENGRAALRRLSMSAGLPDLVLTDLCMPEATGYDLCATLRADLRCAALPIIVMSSLDTLEYREFAGGLSRGPFLGQASRRQGTSWPRFARWRRSRRGPRPRSGGVGGRHEQNSAAAGGERSRP